MPPLNSGVRGEASLDGEEERPAAVPIFCERLVRAYWAMEAVDCFDLHSEDPASVLRYKALEGEEQAARRALVDWVLMRHEDLR